MRHDRLTVKEAQGLKVLRRRIARAKIPSSALDESINLATWNIREFGRRRRLNISVHFIAEILNQFDLIAVTEVRDNLRDLGKVLKVLGPYWKAVFSDYDSDAGGNRERMAYVYDKRAVSFTGLAAEADGPRKKIKKTGEYVPEYSWWRKPYMASFRAGSFDFVLITAHIRWAGGEDERLKPISLLADWVHKRRKDKHVFDKDILLMGDFNIPSKDSKLYRALTRRGLKMPEALMHVRGTNLSERNLYDQIVHSPMHRRLFTNNGGTLNFYANDFKSLFPGVRKTDQEFTYELSDHLPLWIQLNVDAESAELSQLLRGKKK
jgi:endonuclease/exonuclease/phosphatase family metal-dependent hydrolase